MRLTKTLLAAAAFVGASTSTSKAYDLYNSGWNYSQPGFNYGSYGVGDDWYGREYRDLTNSRTLNAPFYHSNASETDLVNAAVYRGVTGAFAWSGNEYNNWPNYSAAFVRGELQTGPAGVSFNAQGFFDYQEGYYTNGGFSFDSRDTTTNLAIGHNSYGIYMDTDGNYYGSNVSGGATVYERDVQVARTGSGFNGAFALSAFASDNSQAISGSFYDENIVGRNVLRVASAFYDGEGGYGPALNGSVIRQADIALGFSGSEGLFAKDGGWLDIRGDLTLGASGTIYIRDGEITSNIYTQYYTPGTLDTVGRLAIETGILSVREHFAQDMSATWGQTLGFRDGAINETRLILEGAGYGFDGEGGAFGPEGSSFGALRSITGDNVQNGNISVVADGEGFFGSSNGAIIGTDAGSKLTINGTVNGLNSGASEGGAFLGYLSEGETIQNGRILSGIDDVLKAGQGELLLTASNLFTGDVQIQEGSLRITNSGALSGTSGHTFVSSGASLVLDNGAGLTLADDIHIDGTGTKDIGGAIHNKSGSNSTSGNLWIDSVGGGDASATVRVDGGTSLSVNNLRTNGSYDTLTVDVGGSGATAGNFVVNGETGAIDSIIKNGTGNASIASVDGGLDNVTVNGGKLEFLGSTSSAPNPHVTGFNKFGVGLLEVRGAHFYEDFDVREGPATLFGNLTLDGTLDNGDFDLGQTVDVEGTLVRTSGTLDVESGATLTQITTDGEGGFFTNGMDIRNASALNVKSGGVVQLNGAEIDLDDTGTITVAGTLSSTDGIYANDDTTVTIQAGGVINANIYATNFTTIAINGGDGEGLAAAELNGNIFADTHASITLGGVINGDVVTYDDATLTLLAGAVHNGDYTAYGDATIVINGEVDDNGLGHDFSISDAALLKGSGTIGGNLTQTGGRVAPGNSAQTLTILGNYSISAGSLQIEIGGNDGPGIDPAGNDQLAVGGTVTVGGTAVLDFEPYNGFESARRGVYQVLATDTGAARATIGTFDAVDLTGLSNRVLFDHSTGRAYGTGLSQGAAGQTFARYGAGNANRSEIGRALWMESIAKDNSGLGDNYGTGALDSSEALPNSGQKVFIQTRDASGVDATQVRTDLGTAAISVLTAADAGAALDALSPEAYVGITELGVRVTRNFAQLPASKRKLAAANEWDFSVGYAGEQITADAGATGFTNYKVSSDQIHLTAARDLSKNLRLTLAAGLDDGEVGAAGFTADTDTQAFGLGLGFTPDTKGWTADLGIALTRTDWDATRGVSQRGSDNEDGLGVALRVSLDPTVDGALSYAPYLGLSYATQDQSAVTEGGADNDGMVGVGFAGYERDSLVSELGLKAEYALKPGTTLTGVVAWEHEFEDGGETTLDAAFTENGVTDTRFAVTSAGFGADIFRVGVGVRVELGAKSALSLGYDALLSSDSKSGQGIKADVSFRF